LGRANTVKNAAHVSQRRSGWAKHVLPMIADRETAVQEELVTQAQRLLVAPWRAVVPQPYAEAQTTRRLTRQHYLTLMSHVFCCGVSVKGRCCRAR